MGHIDVPTRRAGDKAGKTPPAPWHHDIEQCETHCGAFEGKASQLGGDRAKPGRSLIGIPEAQSGVVALYKRLPNPF
jgi:hypothetical protein